MDGERTATDRYDIFKLYELAEAMINADTWEDFIHAGEEIEKYIREHGEEEASK